MLQGGFMLGLGDQDCSKTDENGDSLLATGGDFGDNVMTAKC